MILVLFVFISCDHKVQGDDKYSNVKVRPATKAGQFYPSDSGKLRQSIDDYFRDAKMASVEKPLAIIAPHAGYIFSGQIAADAYNQARNHEYDLVVILGTNHTTAGFNGVSIYPRGGYQTPLGLAEIDEEITAALIEAGDNYTYNSAVHKQEHSVEVQVPFIQYMFPELKIVPIVVGRPDPDLCLNFGRILANVLKNRQALIVASADLSHYPNYEDAQDVDRHTLEAILELNPVELHDKLNQQMKRNIYNLSTCACGEAPIMTALAAAKELGANCGTIISCANSGDALVGDRNRVVGYGAVALTKDNNCQSGEAFNNPPGDRSGRLNDSHKKALLALARKTIRQYLTTETVPLVRGFEPLLENKQGAFVTLNKHGQLRGCIGHMAEDTPLCEVIGSMALSAAFNDRRFNPLKLDELEDIEIEISVLTPYQKIEDVAEIVIGRDGVILEKGGSRSVFLPQVAPEQGWNRDEMLDQLCRKAGLQFGCWTEDATFYIFQAEIFHESEFN